MVPAHLPVKTVARILLKRDGEVGVTHAASSSADLPELPIQTLYSKFLENGDDAESVNRILDLKYDKAKVLKCTKAIDGINENESPEVMLEQISALYVPQMSFFAQFEAKGGVAKIISVTLSSLELWESSALAESWSMWLQELHSFSQIPLFFQLFLKHQKCKDLLFKVLAG